MLRALVLLGGLAGTLVLGCGGDTFGSSASAGGSGGAAAGSGSGGSAAGAGGTAQSSGGASGAGAGAGRGGTGNASSGGNGGAGNGGGGSGGMGMGGAPPICPPVPPTEGEACGGERWCEYPGTCCPITRACMNGQWQDQPCAPPQPVCPDTPPQPNSDCTCQEGLFCDYDECASGTEKRFEFSCEAGASGSSWQPKEFACPRLCDGDICAATEICVEFDANGGSGQQVCAINPCSGPVLCECAGTLCGAFECLDANDGWLSCGFGPDPSAG